MFTHISIAWSIRWQEPQSIRQSSTMQSWTVSTTISVPCSIIMHWCSNFLLLCKAHPSRPASRTSVEVVHLSRWFGTKCRPLQCADEVALLLARRHLYFSCFHLEYTWATTKTSMRKQSFRRWSPKASGPTQFAKASDDWWLQFLTRFQTTRLHVAKVYASKGDVRHVRRIYDELKSAAPNEIVWLGFDSV